MSGWNNKLIAFIDKLLPRLVVCALCALVMAQTALFWDGTRQYLSKTDALEGEQLAVNRPGAKREMPVRTVFEPLYKLRRGKTLIIKILSDRNQPRIFVLVNGQKAADFRNGIAQLTIYENDYLEIDATEQSELVKYRIEGDAGILLPMLGAELETKGDTAAVGRVRFK